MQNDALVKELAVCASAETLLAVMLKHHPDLSIPVAVEAIARSAGIVAIEDAEPEGAACAMTADLHKTRGTISCAPGMTAQRRRFAIAHQLGHFLLKAQRGDRRCTNRDLGESRRDTPHRKEEMQANRFAAGLLMPKPLFVPFVDGLGKPTVTHLPTIAAAYDVTLEVAASRYVDLTHATCALVFCKDGVVRFSRPSRSFPPLSIGTGDTVPPAVRAATPDDKIAWQETEVRDWIEMSRNVRAPKILMQILSKANGFQLVLLFVNAAAERRADEEAEKMATQSPKFGR
ncbi:ImmA/IrrE family metallo-endopeptidase [Sphingobium sufflavum]|uniref:ImmA/IrrE family metallo-endopeptidase n=1 Tax=Sphingobium sufflavum TaxID=1129547 RepID=UPI001F470892|nr:ImmA/IrrE family metallo-endopeptidase [Sphingobium sufflavum]MCE7797135.1 ImmA/IrrE family metallo-endopeptidase [Sphingobium sufflavum]